jgi:hypothetical protein
VLLRTPGVFQRLHHFLKKRRVKDAQVCLEATG